jgi:uncharacterized protein YjbI with pentapeptide repeats
MSKFLPSQKSVVLAIGSVVIILVPLALWKVPQWQVEPLQAQIEALRSPRPTASTPQPKPADPEKIAALEKSRIDAENATRTWLVQGAVGIFAAATAFVAWLNYQATQEKQAAERFSKSVEQLGSDNIHVRLGGIYALEQIAKDAEEKYYWQVMETLTGYVREKSPYLPKAEKKSISFIQAAIEQAERGDSTNQKDIPLLPLDIQAAMTVIARRNYSYGHRLEPHQLNLRAVDLRRLELPPNAQLRSADLSGANLQQADLAQTNLQRANLSGANLQQANLIGANLKHTTLWAANLQHAKLLTANLQQAELQQANLQWAELQRSNLQQANLQQANLQRAELQQAELQRANLGLANLKHARLWSVNLREANLEGANLQQASLIEADLQRASFRDANLQRASLMRANLQEASLMWANLDQAYLADQRIGTFGYSARSSGSTTFKTGPVKGLTRSQLQQAKSYEGTILPHYLLKQLQSIQTEKDTSSPENSPDSREDEEA